MRGLAADARQWAAPKRALSAAGYCLRSRSPSPCHIPASGWPDDSCCLQAAAGASSLATLVSSRSGWLPRDQAASIKQAAGTGLALADDYNRARHHRSAGRSHDGIGADPAVLADLDRTEDYGPRRR